MIGMSILYSTVFGMISGIKQAIADGTNNLVQYSSEYNKSISSIVNLEYMFLSAIQTKHGYVVSGLLDKEETNTKEICFV
mgnify:FL=1